MGNDEDNTGCKRTLCERIMGNDGNYTLSSQSVIHHGCIEEVGRKPTQTTSWKNHRVHVRESPALEKQQDDVTLLEKTHGVGQKNQPPGMESNTPPPEGSPMKRSLAVDALMLLQSAADTADKDAKRSHEEMDQPTDTTNNDLLDAEGNPFDTEQKPITTSNQKARKALGRWYERYRELIEFKKTHGHCNVPRDYDLNPSLSFWVDTQRKSKKLLDAGKKTSMTTRKLQALEKVGFIWVLRQHRPHHSWDERYEQLKAFKRAHRHCQVPTKYAENTALSSWVSKQRTDYKSYKAGKPSAMTEEKIAKLEAIGFVWRVWRVKETLILHQTVANTPDTDEDPNSQVPPESRVEDDKPKQQVAHLVPDYTRPKGKENTSSVLSSTNPVLSDDSLTKGVKRSHDEIDQPPNNDLVDAEGNPRGTGCKVSTLIHAFHMDMNTSDSNSKPEVSSNKKNKRRRQRKLPTRSQRPRTVQTCECYLYPSNVEVNSVTSKQARTALNTWYKRYRELIEFKKANGHCNVPQKYFLNQSLGVWVNKQRMEKKLLDEGEKTSLTPRKLQALEKIEFVWTLKRKGQHGWDEKYEQLKAFKRAHGHCKVPTIYADNTALGRWVSTQRADYKSYKAGKPTFMMEEKIAKLEAVGFVWNAA